MFHGSGDGDDGQLDLGPGVIAILLAMPGMLVSLLMFEKYGSLMHFLNGDLNTFDAFAETISDEYFFVVLSIVVTGVAALWRWDAIFLDRRDYTNLVPLPISLTTIFAANFCAILAFAAFLTIVVNAASSIFFPIAVMGSQSSIPALIRFAAGHAIEIFAASVFSFFFVSAVAGLLMSILPARLFRRGLAARSIHTRHLSSSPARNGLHRPHSPRAIQTLCNQILHPTPTRLVPRNRPHHLGPQPRALRPSNDIRRYR